MNQEEGFMKEALRQAKKAYALEEVPIGCVIEYEGKRNCVIFKILGRNARLSDRVGDMRDKSSLEANLLNVRI